MRKFVALIIATSCWGTGLAVAKDVKVHHVLTLNVFDSAHKKLFTLDRVAVDPQAGPFVTPKVGDLINVSLKGEITHCVVTTTSTTYVLDSDSDPTISVSVGLTQTPSPIPRQE